MPAALGDAFWGNFLLIDEQHSESYLRSKLALMGLRFAPGDGFPVDEAQRNCDAGRAHLRSIGFQVPTSAGKRAMCTWCWQARSCVSTSLQAHLVTCERCPESVKCQYRTKALASKSAPSYFGTQQLAAAQAEEAKREQLSIREEKEHADIAAKSTLTLRKRAKRESRKRAFDAMMERKRLFGGSPAEWLPGLLENDFMLSSEHAAAATVYLTNHLWKRTDEKLLRALEDSAWWQQLISKLAAHIVSLRPGDAEELTYWLGRSMKEVLQRMCEV